MDLKSSLHEHMRLKWLGIWDEWMDCEGNPNLGLFCWEFFIAKCNMIWFSDFIIEHLKLNQPAWRAPIHISLVTFLSGHVLEHQLQFSNSTQKHSHPAWKLGWRLRWIKAPSFQNPYPGFMSIIRGSIFVSRYDQAWFGPNKLSHILMYLPYPPIMAFRRID